MNIASVTRAVNKVQIKPSRKNHLIAVLAALGMMAGLLQSEVRGLTTWAEATNPKFVASFLGHFSIVIAAYISGKLAPENRRNKRTRSDDA